MNLLECGHFGGLQGLTPAQEHREFRTALETADSLPSLAPHSHALTNEQSDRGTALSYYRNANQEDCLFLMSPVIERTKEYNTRTQIERE